jgi:hypothetical protein
LSFLKDRVDTIRVYRSVNGNMTGLQEFYSMHGLEHFLQFDEAIKSESRLAVNCQENFSTKRLLPTNNSFMCCRDVEFSPMQATMDIVQCLESHEPVNDHNVSNSRKLNADGCDTILHQPPTNEKECEKRSLPSSFLSSTPSVRKVFSVDVDTLRTMNLEFLTKMGYNVGPSSQTLISKGSVNNSRPSTDSNRPIIWQVKEELPNSMLEISQRDRKSLNTAILAAMDRALEIAKNCCESTCLSDQLPADLDLLPVGTNSDK